MQCGSGPVEGTAAAWQPLPDGVDAVDQVRQPASLCVVVIVVLVVVSLCGSCRVAWLTLIGAQVHSVKGINKM